MSHDSHVRHAESERGGFVTEKALRFSMLQKKWAR